LGDIFNAFFIIQARGPGANWLVPEPAGIRRTTNMNAGRKPDGPPSASQTFEFVHRRPDYVVRVENHAPKVLIRVIRGCLSEREKDFFVRHLAAEGFIPDCYRWFSGDYNEASSGIEWCVEDCSVKNNLKTIVTQPRASVVMIRFLICASILWLVELTFLFSTTDHQAHPGRRLNQRQAHTVRASRHIPIAIFGSRGNSNDD
jgi:hypothetical protein